MSEEKIRKMAEAAIEVEKPWYRARIVDHADKLRVDSTSSFFLANYLN